MGAGVLRWGVAAALGAWLAASPCAAMSWNEYVASFGPRATPADVLAYLKSNPIVQAAPHPRFSEIHTETVDGSVAQAYRMTGFADGLGHLEGTREERAAGSVRTGEQSLTMTTALGGVVLVALDNKTTGAYVGLRRIMIEGALFPPTEGGQGKLHYQRVQLSECRQRPFHHFLDVRGCRNIAIHREGARPGALERVHQGLGRIRIVFVIDGNIVALAPQANGNPFADAGICSSDQNRTSRHG